jgi:hypothetical protein
MEENRPIMPKAQIAYGETIYWLCVVAAIICMVGPFVALLNIDNNYLNPHFLFSAIWEGKDALAVWQAAGQDFPGGHFWMDYLTTGDGLTQAGIALGGFVAAPALVLAAIYYLREREYLWTALSLWVVLLVAVSAIGVVGASH